MQALSDVTILDLTHHIAGPYCTKMLADYGANVIKVERPGIGDVSRSMGPFPEDVPHPEKSGIFLHLNSNKRGITLDFKTNTGKQIFLELVKNVDVIIESFSPSTLSSAGLGYKVLETVNPRIILVSISNFGQYGPYRDYKATEIVLHGMGGNLHSLGIPEREPTKYGTEIALRQAGLIAASATMAALFNAEDRKEGEHVDVSIFETQAGSQDRRVPQLMTAQFIHKVFPRREPGAAIASGTFPCKDGYINLSGGGNRFPRVLEMLDKPELIEDPRFSTPAARTNADNGEFFNSNILMPWLMQYTMREAWSLAQKAHVLSGPIYTSESLMDDSHFQDRNMWVDIDHPVAGKYRFPGRPFVMSETPWTLRSPAPTLGQHNPEIYTGMLGYENKDLVLLRANHII